MMLEKDGSADVVVEYYNNNKSTALMRVFAPCLRETKQPVIAIQNHTNNREKIITQPGTTTWLFLFLSSKWNSALRRLRGQDLVSPSDLKFI